MTMFNQIKIPIKRKNDKKEPNGNSELEKYNWNEKLNWLKVNLSW